MSSGLSIVAADTAVHREICGDAAVYFPAFSCEALADEIAILALNENNMKDLRGRGHIRAMRFSWNQHVERLLQIAQELILAS